MVLNVELLDGATLEYEGVFYLLSYENKRLTITELFTGVRPDGSELELEIMREVMKQIEQNPLNE
ncbi:hypothetical protein [Vibrio parahaemolyticus]|uniref:hypothetical protein n=1 Tax=Vibrio parahaemolyticus TaxID=670 RepID=UPI00301CFF71|nr:hypothetical protein [Vibrio parahaemolyticus]